MDSSQGVYQSKYLDCLNRHLFDPARWTNCPSCGNSAALSAVWQGVIVQIASTALKGPVNLDDVRIELNSRKWQWPKCSGCVCALQERAVTLKTSWESKRTRSPSCVPSSPLTPSHIDHFFSQYD
jgi:hypothetical protein